MLSRKRKERWTNFHHSYLIGLFTSSLLFENTFASLVNYFFRFSHLEKIYRSFYFSGPKGDVDRFSPIFRAQGKHCLRHRCGLKTFRFLFISKLMELTLLPFRSESFVARGDREKPVIHYRVVTTEINQTTHYYYSSGVSYNSYENLRFSVR